MNWKQALALGLCSVGVYAKKKEPVAYLYGAVVAPKIPVVDGYNYAYVEELTETDQTTLSGINAYGYCARCVISTAPLTCGTAGLSVSGLGATENCSVNRYIYRPNVDSTWVFEDSRELTAVVSVDSWFSYENVAIYLPTYDKARWSNYDIPKRSGGIFHEASVPTSVTNGMLAYGGVSLPGLPKGTVYENMLIWVEKETFDDTSLNYVLVCSDTPIQRIDSGTRYVEDGHIQYWVLSEATDEWKGDYRNNVLAGELVYTNYGYNYMQWSNHAIFKDGKVWFPASEPIPINT